MNITYQDLLMMDVEDICELLDKIEAQREYEKRELQKARSKNQMRKGR